MSTPAVTPAQPNGFIRFIDAIGAFFKKAAPVIKETEAVAVAAEPFLALTPFGPEYDLCVNAIVGAQQTAEASIAAGANLTGVQKFALALSAVTPGITAILASKGITETAAQQNATSQFLQNVYNLQAGPAIVKSPASPVSQA